MYSKNCKKTSMKHFKLDPTNYITTPGPTWDAMLKFSNIELDLITDINMLEMIERHKQGGLCFVGNNRYTKSNNKYQADYDQQRKINKSNIPRR